MSNTPAPVWHQPALPDEVLQYLAPRPGGVIVDGTVGTGGHSAMILPRLLPQGRLLAIDRDPEALALARHRLTEFEPQVTVLHGNYRELPRHLGARGIAGVDGILLDLGMSSLHVERAERGFSFSKEGPLDMRMDPAQDATAASLVNRLTADELSTLLRQFGEERFAARIARRIVEARRAAPITTTTQLARLTLEAVPPAARHGRLHPSTRTFQALRIAVNDELGALEQFLSEAHGWLNPGGRLVVLSFHSLEDRLVKRAFADGARAGIWTVLTKKPVRPSAGEVARNPRARSTRLRAVERRA